MLISLPLKNGKFPKTTIFQTAGVAQPIELSKICRHFNRAGIIPKIMFLIQFFIRSCRGAAKLIQSRVKFGFCIEILSFFCFFLFFYSRVVSFNKFKVDLLKISVVLGNWSLVIAISLCFMHSLIFFTSD